MEVNKPVLVVLLREALGVHGVLTHAGILPDDIYLSFVPAGPLQIHVKQNDLTFVIDVGADVTATSIGLTAELLRVTWSETLLAYNAASAGDRKALVDRTAARKAAPALLTAMIAKGFAFANHRTN